jgi:hypothetical protein
VDSVLDAEWSVDDVNANLGGGSWLDVHKKEEGSWEMYQYGLSCVLVSATLPNTTDLEA